MTPRDGSGMCRGTPFCSMVAQETHTLSLSTFKREGRKAHAVTLELQALGSSNEVDGTQWSHVAPGAVRSWLCLL